MVPTELMNSLILDAGIDCPNKMARLQLSAAIPFLY
jgi:hypothetical protein